MNIHTIPCFNKYLPDTHYIDVFNKGTGILKWKAISSVPWILVDKKAGKTRYEDRITVSVDWQKAPVGESGSGSIDIYTNNNEKKQYLFLSLIRQVLR